MKKRKHKRGGTSGRRLTVYLFNVGQGDHILIRLPSGEYGIIDFHYGCGLMSPPALGYLQKLRRRLNPNTPIVISFICLSHPDYDHVMGVKAMLDWVKDKSNNVLLKNMWVWPGNIFEDLVEQYEDYGHAAEATEGTVKASEVSLQLRALMKFRDGSGRSKTKIQYIHGVEKVAGSAGGFKVVSLAPLGTHVKKFDRQAQRDFVRLKIEGDKDPGAKKKPSAKQNLLSSILMLAYGGHRLLFGGDASEEIWRDCLEHYNATAQHEEHGPFKGCFVKASHHGSKHSSSTVLWRDILFPRAHVGISAGSQNSYGHPHRETLQHMFDAFKIPGDRPKILATNSCQRCVSSQNIPLKHIDWVAAKRPKLDPLVEKSLSHYRWKPRASARRRPLPVPHGPVAGKNLAAYIFNFGDGEKVTVTKGVSSAILCDTKCIYGGSSLDFPMCALDLPPEVSPGAVVRPAR